MTSHRVLLQRIVLIASTNVLLSLSSIILLPILTQNLPIADYGIWAQINITINLVPGIAMLGLPFAMTRFLPSANTREDTYEIFNSVMLVVLISSAMVCMMIYLFSDLIALKLFDDNVTIVRLVILITFIECLNNTYTGYFRAKQQMKLYSIFSIVQTIISFILVSFFVFSGRGIIGATIGLLIKSILILFALTYIVFHEIQFKIPRFTYLKEILQYGIPTIPINFSRWVVESSDRYVIALFLGTVAVGYYTPGYTLGNIVHMIVAPLSFILPAALSNYYDGKKIAEVKKILNISLKYYLLIAIPTVFGLSFLSKPILLIISTPEIASNGYLITPFTAVSALFFGVISIYNQVLLLEKKTKVTGKIVSFCAVLNLGLNFILIPYIGIIGAATTTLFAYIVNIIFIIYYSSKYIKIEINVLYVIKSLIASLMMVFIILYTESNNFFETLCLIGICASVYFLVMILLKGIGKNELNLFRKFLKA